MRPQDASVSGGRIAAVSTISAARPARVALAVDERECWDREILDRGDRRDNRRLELGGPGLVKPDEDRDVRAHGEIIALGPQQQGPNVTVGCLVDGDTQVGEQIRGEEVLRRVVDHDLAEPLVLMEGRERHLSGPSRWGMSRCWIPRTSREPT
jgi:hypothetical protein